jgi:hypothetical protein
LSSGGSHEEAVLEKFIKDLALRMEEFEDKENATEMLDDEFTAF